MSREVIFYNYKFFFDNGDKKEFNVQIDDKTLFLVNDEKKPLPEWTKLKNFKCPHCPLDENVIEYCPVAANLVEVLETFRELESSVRVDMVVESDARSYSRRDSLQTGVSGLIGLLMAASSCPIIGRLKPLVKYHIPYSTLDEAEYRVFSMYLLGQYFAWKKGIMPDWGLENLYRLYEDIRILNRSICDKLAAIETKDAAINSIVALDCFAEYINFNIEERSLDDIEALFAGFLFK